jgi:hypothetical protein
MRYAAAMEGDNDRGIKLIAGGGVALCALVLLVIFFAGWRDEQAATVFVTCLLFLPICAARVRGR